MTLPPHVAARIKRLVPLLASTHDGEVIATRNAIVRELAAGQSDLHDLAASIGCGVDPLPAAKHRSAAPAAFGDLARAVRDVDGGRLRPSERAFVRDMCAKGFGFRPSPGQSDYMADLFARLSGRAAA